MLNIVYLYGTFVSHLFLGTEDIVFYAICLPSLWDAVKSVSFDKVMKKGPLHDCGVSFGFVTSALGKQSPDNDLFVSALQ